MSCIVKGTFSAVWQRRLSWSRSRKKLPCRFSLSEPWKLNINLPNTFSLRWACRAVRRPVLILSNNLGNTHGPTVIAAPITSRRHKKAGLPTHAQIPVLGDLTTDSVVLLEQIRVLDKQRLQARLGRLPYSYIQKIDKALAVSIGLWDKCWKHGVSVAFS